VNPPLLNNDSESMADLQDIALPTLFLLGPGIKDPGYASSPPASYK
jgi:hypothetical protein